MAGALLSGEGEQADLLDVRSFLRSIWGGTDRHRCVPAGWNGRWAGRSQVGPSQEVHLRVQLFWGLRRRESGAENLVFPRFLRFGRTSWPKLEFCEHEKVLQLERKYSFI